MRVSKHKHIYNSIPFTKIFGFLAPPEKPKLFVVSSTVDSLELKWEVEESSGNNILGYVINYKRDQGDWEELQIDNEINSYTLQNLWCATRYQLYITAYNKIGMGLPCDIVNGYTLGTGY